MKVINPKNGEAINSPYATHEEARAALKAKLGATLKGNAFASDIYEATGKADKATAGRVFYLHKLAMQEDQAPKPSRNLDLSGLHKMLESAKAAGLKYPSITLTLKSGAEVKVSIAGDKSKYKGSVMIASAGFGVGNPYYGRVTDGALYAGRDLTTEVEGLLTDLAYDPKGTASRMGKLTGNCCCCRRKLEHEDSLALGYGSTCAKKFGFDHGRKAAKAKKSKVEQFVSGELKLDLPVATASPRRIIRRHIEGV